MFNALIERQSLLAETIKDITNEIQHLQLMVGSKMCPEYPTRSHADFFTT